MIKLVVGLGNPGTEYVKTRHNVGAWLVTQMAQQQHLTLRLESKLQSQLVRADAYSQPIWLMIPTTYMNLSGQAVSLVANYYKIAVESILVAHDELDFPAGTIRIKQGGGHGGHNGLRSIMQSLNTPDFYRLRIGIGHPGSKDKVTPYVLSPPSRTDEAEIFAAIEEGLGVMPQLIAGEFQKAFHVLHSD